MDIRGRSQQVSGATLQGGGVSLCLRDEEANARERAPVVGADDRPNLTATDHSMWHPVELTHASERQRQRDQLPNHALLDQARRLRRRGPGVSARALPWEARPGARRAPSAEWRRSTWLIRLRGPVWRTAVLLGPGATVQWRGCLRGVVSGVDAMLAQDDPQPVQLGVHAAQFAGQ